MKKGFTMIELIASIAVVLVLLSVLIANYDVLGNKKKARDVKRLSDLVQIERAVAEYQMANKVYPDLTGVLRISNVLPAGNSRVENSTSGWIDENLVDYLSKMPVDPINDQTYHYSYMHNSSGYEINARLESLTDQMQNDGGNDPTVFETGTNLLLISP
jgi:prepilin-type N-terminal cleavage/methylation domain-containing protein